ncbi:putative heme-binding peroxidase [Spathaspora sp. JA1]|nr:putative heme-binding peroxidase [Spathaspora sp. JA1]
MRFVPEITDEGNTGLDIARGALEPIKQMFPKISYSDLWTLAGKLAIEEMGGPTISWKGGRVDCRDARFVPQAGKLPFANKDAHHIRATFERMGFDDQETVALLGAHGLGRCHKRFSGWEGKWTSKPIQFSNEFFQVLLNEEWSLGVVPETGREQYFNHDKSLIMLNTDLELIRDVKFLVWVKSYAKDEELFFQDFAQAFSKLLELGIDRDEQGQVMPKRNY